MRPSLRQQLAEFIRRRQGNQSLEYLARRIGISAATLCRLRAGTTNCSLDTLEQICRVFHCTLADVFPHEFPRPALQTVPIASPYHVQSVPLPTVGVAERSG